MADRARLSRHPAAVLAGILAAEGALDPAERRNRLLAQQAAIWRRAPPRDPVIAAGLTGGIPALTELISVVAGLEQGAVILPGLDRFCDMEQWAAIEDDPAHPQHLMALLLQALDLSPADVRDWELPLAGRAPRAQRLRLVCEALRPAATTDAWRDLAPQPPKRSPGSAATIAPARRTRR